LRGACRHRRGRRRRRSGAMWRRLDSCARGAAARPADLEALAARSPPAARRRTSRRSPG
jgi:hypothetical protein